MRNEKVGSLARLTDIIPTLMVPRRMIPSLEGGDSEITVYRQSRRFSQRPTIPSLLTSHVHVWQFPLTVSDSEFPACAEGLSEDERARAGKFRIEKDARRFVVARASMRFILAEYVHSAARDLRFVYSKYGKPSLADPVTEIRFNLSHAGESAILGITRSRNIGVDIEAVNRNVECDKLAKRFFSTHERAWLRHLPEEERSRCFFRIWTCKEAFLKAQGFGLTRSLDSFDIDLSSGTARLLATRPDAREAQLWSLIEIETSPQHAAAVAVEGGAGALSLIRYEDNIE